MDNRSPASRTTQGSPNRISRHQRGHMTKTIQNTQQTRDTPSIARASMQQAAEWPAYSAPIARNSPETPDLPASTCTRTRHTFHAKQWRKDIQAATAAKAARVAPDTSQPRRRPCRAALEHGRHKSWLSATARPSAAARRLPREVLANEVRRAKLHRLPERSSRSAPSVGARP